MINKPILITSAKNTWCPGCGNFAILNSAKAVLGSLMEEGVPKENIVILSGIGCHAKISDYLDFNSFYSLHGRAVPVAEAIKTANPKLKVIVFAGDGDSYGEGLEHLIFAAKRNIDITVVIHTNRVYALTVGQYSPVSPFGFKGRSTAQGTVEPPMNPLSIMLASGASHIARGYSMKMDLLKKTLREAIAHKGFSIVDVLQVCVSFFNRYEEYNKRVYELKDHNAQDYNDALVKIREWDYNSEDSPIALGTFYKQERPAFEEMILKPNIVSVNRDAKIKEILNNSI